MMSRGRAFHKVSSLSAELDEDAMRARERAITLLLAMRDPVPMLAASNRKKAASLAAPSPPIPVGIPVPIPVAPFVPEC